nr:unnamed protein product [Digitaria exilis]
MITNFSAKHLMRDTRLGHKIESAKQGPMAPVRHCKQSTEQLRSSKANSSKPAVVVVPAAASSAPLRLRQASARRRCPQLNHRPM